MKIISIIAASAIAFSACSSTDPVAVPEPTRNVERDIRVGYIDLTANEGCTTDSGGTCDTATLQGIADNVEQYEFDVLFVTNAPTPELCAADSPCKPSPEASAILTGPTVSCSPDGLACIILHEDLEIAGCTGGVCVGSLEQHALPTAWRCDDQTAIYGATIQAPNGKVFDVATVALPSTRPPFPVTFYSEDGSADVELNTEADVVEAYKQSWRAENCRTRAIEHIFSGSLDLPGALNTNRASMALGRFGLDPYNQLVDGDRLPDDLNAWDRFVSSASSDTTRVPYGYLSGILLDGQTTLAATERGVTGRETRLSHVLSNEYILGGCYPIDGETATTFDWVNGATTIDANLTNRLQRFGFVCELQINNP